ncbi:hypothetical protein [Methylophilus sp. Leaf414]|uniref:hypothetical protein n=1 Tax=Methylophilus sp. Leaf414 TaxID=1736371 RepID=UPI000A7C9708|nr:hypothetical protein [Methylophilus sp. Leaf414]
MTVNYFANGEGSLSIDVTFDSGKILHFNEGYIENGYALDLIIKKNEISKTTIFINLS